MAHYLVIVESPAKVKTIKKFLGSNYTVAASQGHVRDLPKSQLGIEVENDYEPKYITLCEENDDNSLEGIISVVELMGSSLHLHVDTITNKNIVIIVPIINLEKDKLSSLITGNKVHFKWNYGLEHLFSKQTSMNLISEK